jgi:Flp pilus assembly protein TadD
MLLNLVGQTGFVGRVSFSPDGKRIISGAWDGTVKVWDAQTGTPLLGLDVANQRVSSVSFSHDGKRILATSAGGFVNGKLVEPGMATVWEARTQAPIVELKGDTLPVEYVSFSPDGTRIVTAGDASAAKIWDARTGKHLFDLSGNTHGTTCLAYSPDGTRIFTGTMSSPGRIWDANTGTALLELSLPKGFALGAGFSPDSRWIVIGFGEWTSQEGGAGVWDVQTGALSLELAGLNRRVVETYFTPDGRRIAVFDGAGVGSVWDARTGQQLKDEPVPIRPHPQQISPDGRWIAQPAGINVEIIPLRPDAAEIAYRLLRTEPNYRQYRQAYDAARAAGDEFAAQFNLKRLPENERTLQEAPAAASRELAAAHTRSALAYFTAVSVANPEDLLLAAKVAALQAWFGQRQEFADTCRRSLAFAQDTTDPPTAERAAKVCSLWSEQDPTKRESALALARRAVEFGSDHDWLPYYRMALGMAEYRSGNFADADAALTAAIESATNNSHIACTSAFYRTMSLFKQGKKDEAQTLLAETAAKMRPLPDDDENPLAENADADDLILWLAYKEAKGVIGFEDPQTASQ